MGLSDRLRVVEALCEAGGISHSGSEIQLLAGSPVQSKAVLDGSDAAPAQRQQHQWRKGQVHRVPGRRLFILLNDLSLCSDKSQSPRMVGILTSVSPHFTEFEPSPPLPGSHCAGHTGASC